MTRIFISYRRQDTADHAERIYTRLRADFGSGAVFRDVETIEPGDRFDRAIEDAVGTCDVLLALIGPEWLGAADATGRRLDADGDYVRREIAAALTRNVLIIPVLLKNAAMPRAADLPPTLSDLALHNAIEIRDDRWPLDIAKLEHAIQRVVKLKSAGVTISLRQQYCPVCGEPLGLARAPRSWRQALWGGFVCSKCGTQLDRLARVVR